MAFTDALNTTGALFFQYDELTVLLGPEDGSNPSLGVDADPEADPPVEAEPPDFFEGVVCTRVVQSAGGSRLDFAELTYKLTEHLEEREQPAGFARVVEVRLPNEDATLLHRGDYVRESAVVTQQSESLTAQSQLRAYHFGGPLEKYDVHNPHGGINMFIEDDIVFNPTIDDKTVFNRSSVTRTGTGLSGHKWAHPELADTSIGEAFQEQTREEWNLREAVRSVCETLNPDQEFINNPLSVDLDILDDAPPVRNIRIPLGTYLPQALDLLLIPHGYNWWIDYTETTPWIEFFKIGAGTEKELKFQAPGSVLDLEESNVNQFSTENAIGDSFNEVRAYGEFEEAECTFPLFAAWAPEHDDVSPGDLAKDGAEYHGKETVWRLFIANEAGDIDPAVSRFGQLPEVPDLRLFFLKYIPHRRVLGEPLTYLQSEVGSGSGAGSGSGVEGIAGDKQRRPHVIEWSDDAGETWKPSEDGWTIKLCPDQIGILFDSKDIPQELYDAGSNGRLRITGTIFGDGRITYLAQKQSHAANARKVVQVIAKPEKFQKRFRWSSGTYMSVLSGDYDERDDSEAIQEFAEKLRDRNHYAEVDCEFRLPGWHLEYKIGDLITKIAGREINLDAAPTGAPSHRYVQIIERRFEMSAEGGPSTVLIVDRGVSQA